MPAAALHPNETERLRVLDDYQVLDTPPEPAFDSVTTLAAAICEAPISVVNLIGEGRQFFKSEVGLGVRETPLDTSFCAHALLEDDMMVVPDATRDARFDCNPLVTGDPRLRFYAGALLRAPSGHALGTLCVLDTKPRDLDARQIDSLRVLAHHVMTMLDLRRREREQRALGEQLARALAGRDRVLATVAHDLRTPLSVVTMGADLLAEEPTLTGDPVVARIRRAAVTMERLATDLLAVQRSRAELPTLETERLELTALIRDTLDTHQGLAERAGVQLVSRGGPAAVIRADAARLEQVLSNLLGNAIKFSPPGAEVALGWDADDGVVTVCVHDEGKGVSEDAIERLFDPWKQVEQDSRGAGLGLAICKSIVEAHGGTLAVESTPGRGSTFCFSIPQA